MYYAIYVRLCLPTDVGGARVRVYKTLNRFMGDWPNFRPFFFFKFLFDAARQSLDTRCRPLIVVSRTAGYTSTVFLLISIVVATGVPCTGCTVRVAEPWSW